MVVTIFIAAIPAIINKERFEDDKYIFFWGIILFLLYIVYIVGHELVHGIAYKSLTKEKLTFGVSLTCAFCGVPKIYTYRKTALIAILSPLITFTIILVPLMVITYGINIYLYTIVAVLFSGHLGGCVGDIYVAFLFLIKYRSNKTLMNDTGPKMTFYVYDENQTIEEISQTEHIVEINEEQQ